MCSMNAPWRAGGQLGDLHVGAGGSERYVGMTVKAGMSWGC
jgi:hypothetical protein